MKREIIDTIDIIIENSGRINIKIRKEWYITFSARGEQRLW